MGAVTHSRHRPTITKRVSALATPIIIRSRADSVFFPGHSFDQSLDLESVERSRRTVREQQRRFRKHQRCLGKGEAKGGGRMKPVSLFLRRSLEE
jgi:hypothetical protein